MKDMKNKAAQHKHFGLMDIFIILLILAIAAAAVYAYVPELTDKITGSGEAIEYTVIFSGLDAGTLAGLSTGDGVLCGITDFGTVRSVTARNCVTYAYSEEENIFVKNTDESLFDAVVVISVSADKADTGYSISGQMISAGLTYELVLPSYSGTCLCTAVNAEAAE